MRSAFSGGRRKVLASVTPQTDENYDLKGLNLVAPDQVMPGGETPFTINSRRYADNDDETSVAIRTRQGSTELSTPVGLAANVLNDGAVTEDIILAPGLQIAIPFTTTGPGALTKFELYIKKATNTRGYVIIEIYTNSIDLPSEKVAQTSIAPSAIAESFGYVPALLIDAPSLLDATQYWAVISTQDLGVGAYSLGKTAAGGLHTTIDGMKTYSIQTYGARFKTYTSTAGLLKGFTKRYPEDTANMTLFALGDTVYKMPDSPAVPEVLEAAVVAVGSEDVGFMNIDERTFWWDGVNPARWWDGVAIPAVVPNVPSANGPPVNGLIFENRALWVPDGDRTRVDFSALYDFETYPEVNFFYIGRPKSPDHITAWHEFRESATIFTKETKWTLQGTDIQTFQPVPHKGTKGAVSQKATAVGKAAIYFMADDRNIYAWDGSRDILVSRKVHPELKKILDVDKVRLHVYNNQLRVYYNRNPDPSITYMLLLEIEDNQWYRDTGRPVMGSMEWTHNDNELVEFSSKAGWLFFGERGYSDLGKRIDFKYWTSYRSYGSGAAKDRIKRFRPIVRPAQSSYYLKVGKDIDFQNKPVMRDWLVDSGGAPWGTFNWGDGTVYGGSKVIDNTSPMSGRGKHTQYRFEHDGIDQPVNLLGYIALIKSGRPR